MFSRRETPNLFFSYDSRADSISELPGRLRCDVRNISEYHSLVQAHAETPGRDPVNSLTTDLNQHFIKQQVTNFTLVSKDGPSLPLQPGW